MFIKQLKYNLQLVTEVVKTCKIHRFPGAGTRCAHKQNPKKKKSSLLLGDRREFQASVPLNLDDTDYREEDEGMLNGYPEEISNITERRKLLGASTRKSWSSPTILVACRCNSPVDLPDSLSCSSGGGDIGFPLPAEVSDNDPVFQVVVVDVHEPVTSEGVNEDVDLGIFVGRNKEGIPLEDIPTNLNDGDNKMNYLICEDTDSVFKEDDNESIAHPLELKLSESKSQTFVDDLESSTKSKIFKGGRVVGYFDAPNFACMKSTVSGKVWLWTRSEDLLIIKDDGRVIDPSGMAKRVRCHKSYHNQVKSSIGKLYDKIFSKKEKEKELTNSEKWATSSLDRHLGKSTPVKHALHSSLSTSNVNTLSWKQKSFGLNMFH